MGDTGLMVSLSFSENDLVTGEIQQRILTGRLERNLGMLWETVVAQMLRAAGHRLFFHVNSDGQSSENRMEIDFLISKTNLQRRHNIVPIEVKGTGEYETRSLDKFLRKYEPYLSDAYVIHTKNLQRGDQRVYLPVYMTQQVHLH